MNAPHKCDDCGWTGDYGDMDRVWPDIPGLWERTEPGGMVPSGECPECRALCYPMDVEAIRRESASTNK